MDVVLHFAHRDRALCGAEPGAPLASPPSAANCYACTETLVLAADMDGAREACLAFTKTEEI